MVSERSKVALVTGSSRGIGRAIAIELATEGFDIFVHCRQDEASAQQVARNVEKLGRRSYVLQGDLAVVEEIDQLFDEVARKAGRLDAFIANAAASVFRPALELRDYNVDRTFAISLRAFVLGSQRAAKLMDKGGSIVAISGLDAARVIELNAAKGAAKAAVEAMVRYFAWELGPHGIRVNAVRPGYIWSTAGQLAASIQGVDYEERMKARAALTPLRRWGDPADVAGVVAFLVSERARFVTGETIGVDGGLSLAARA